MQKLSWNYYHYYYRVTFVHTHVTCTASSTRKGKKKKKSHQKHTNKKLLGCVEPSEAVDQFFHMTTLIVNYPKKYVALPVVFDII